MACTVNTLEGQNEKSEVTVCQHHRGSHTESLQHCFHPVIRQILIEHLLYMQGTVSRASLMR